MTTTPSSPLTNPAWTIAGDLYVGSASAGNLSISNSPTLGPGVVNTSGSAFVGVSGTGIVNLSGGNWTIGDRLEIGAGADGVLNLIGGFFSTSQISEGSGNGTLNFGDGTLLLTANQTALFDGFEAGDVVLVGPGGGTIDTQSFHIATSLGLTGSGSLTKLGNGTLTLAGNNTFSGGVTVAGGTLSLGSSTAAGTGTLTTSGAEIEYADGVTVPNTILLNYSETRLRVLSGSATQQGNITETGGARSLEKIGTGALTLTGNNTYSGGTTIAGGSLIVIGSLGNIIISPGGILGGNGSVGGIDLNGGVLAPGPGASDLTADSLFWNSGISEIDLGGSAAESDSLLLTGALTGGVSPHLFTFVNNGWVIGQTYTLITFGSTGIAVGNFGFTNGGGFAGTFAYDGNTLEFTLVPEPGAYLLGILGFFGLIVLFLRRRRVC